MDSPVSRIFRTRPLHGGTKLLTVYRRTTDCANSTLSTGYCISGEVPCGIIKELIGWYMYTGPGCVVRRVAVDLNDQDQRCANDNAGVSLNISVRKRGGM